MSIERPALEEDTQWGRMFLSELTVPLPGGLTGHFQRDADSCHRACIATILQCDYEQVPDTHNPGWSERVDEFAASRGLWIKRFIPGAMPPLGDIPVGLWIGTWPPMPETRMYHAVVCFHRQEFFDPASGWVWEDGVGSEPAPGPFEAGTQFIPKETH